jgi:hypothetical protein
VTYNAELSVFGLVRLTLSWLGQGVIQGDLLTTSMPAIIYQVCECAPHTAAGGWLRGDTVTPARLMFAHMLA